jgi:molybdate transport system regulatory protein
MKMPHGANGFQCKPRIRIVKGKTIALGPGKVDLLEAVDRVGSISQAARLMKLSYRRAWDMIHMINQNFKTPLVARVAGGKGGGGAYLTEEGKSVVCLYRKMELGALVSMQKEWVDLQKLLRDPDSEDSDSNETK